MCLYTYKAQSFRLAIHRRYLYLAIGLADTSVQEGSQHFLSWQWRVFAKPPAESPQALPGGSRGHTAAVVPDLAVVLFTILIRDSGSVIRFGMQSIYSALMHVLDLPALGSSAASLIQTPRDAASCGFVPFWRFPAASEITVGHFLALLARLLQLRRSLRLLFQRNYVF